MLVTVPVIRTVSMPRDRRTDGKNVPAGAPNFMYNWGEDSIMRERIFVPTDKQQDYELFPQTLPGAPGAPSPAS